VQKFEGAAAPKGGNVVSCKMSTWVGQYAPLGTFLFVDQSSPNFFCPMWKGLRLIKFFFRCSICRSVPEIFGIKVESCRKSRRNLDVFALTNFRGQAFQKLYADYYPCQVHQVAWKRLVKIDPSRPKVIGTHTLNFRPKFKFCIFFWGGGGPRPHCGVR